MTGLRSLERTEAVKEPFKEGERARARTCFKSIIHIILTVILVQFRSGIRNTDQESRDAQVARSPQCHGLKAEHTNQFFTQIFSTIASEKKNQKQKNYNFRNNSKHVTFTSTFIQSSFKDFFF